MSFCTLLLRVEILTLKQTAHISQIITTKVAYFTLNKSTVMCYAGLMWMCNAGQDTGMGHAGHMSHMHATWLQGLPSSEYSA